MGEERLAAVFVPGSQGVPQLARLLGQVGGPGLVAGVDGPGRGGVGEARRLSVEGGALDLEFQAGVAAKAIEELQRERVQRRRERHMRIGAKSVAQRERAVRGQLGHQPIGDRPQTFVGVRRFGDRIGACRGVRIALVTCGGRVRIGFRRGGKRSLVLGTDEAALDVQFAGAIDRDEGAGAGDILGRISDRAVLEGLQGRFDLAQPRVHRLG